MKRLLSIIIISILLVTPSFAQSTQDMFLACKDFKTHMKKSGDSFNMPNTADAGICWGAFSVLHSLLFFYQDDGTPSLNACVPKEVTATQLIHIFVKHAEDNPQILHKNFAITAINLMIDTFPCTETKVKELKKKSTR